MPQPWTKLLLPVAKSLAEVQAELQGRLQRAVDNVDDASDTDALRAALARIEGGLLAMQHTLRLQPGRLVEMVVQFFPALFGVGGAENLNVQPILDEATKDVEAIRGRLAADIAAATVILADPAPDISARLDDILKFLQTDPPEADVHEVTKVVIHLFRIFHDPVIRLLSRGWNGLLGAITIGFWCFCVAVAVSVLPTSWQFVGFILGWCWFLYLIIASVATDVEAFCDALFGDSAHPVDPLGQVETVLGVLLLRRIQARAIFVCPIYAVNLPGQPLALASAFIYLAFVSIGEMLLFCLAVYAVCGLLYSCAFLVWRLSQFSQDSIIGYSILILGRLYGIVRRAVAWVYRMAVHILSRILPTSTRSRLPLYSFRRLDAARGEIRLLKLERLEPFATAKYDLVLFPLTSAPPYEAISYRWQTTMRDTLRPLLPISWGRQVVGRTQSRGNSFCPDAALEHEISLDRRSLHQPGGRRREAQPDCQDGGHISDGNPYPRMARV
jgi:hypothetical protein